MPAAPAATTTAPQPVHLRALVQLPGGADLRDLWQRPAGTARIAEAVTRLRDASSHAVAEQWPAIASRLPAGVTATIAEPLWIDNSAIVDLDVAAGAAPDTMDKVHAVLGWQALLVPAPLPTGTPPVPASSPGEQKSPAARLWNLDRLGAYDAWAGGNRGAGVTVGIVDGGVNTDHPALRDAYRGASHIAGTPDSHAGNLFDPRSPNAVPAAPRWTMGHGTWVAGLVAGTGVGVAPDAKLIASVQWGTTPGATDAQEELLRRIDFVRSMQWMTAPVGADGKPDPSRAALIVNDSWHAANGARQDVDRYLDTTLANMAAAGIVNVVAAGNEGGPGWIHYPADLDTVIAVTGTDHADRQSPGLAQGPSHHTTLTKPDVAAPEADITSLRAGGAFQTDQHGYTSSATPEVSGVLAIVDGALIARGEAPVDVREARFVLGQLARDVDVPGPDVRTGMGIPDLRRLDAALPALRSQRSGAQG